MPDLWYYTCEGKQMEPVPTAEMSRLVAEGVLKASDLVWREGLPRWMRAGSLPELFPVGTGTVEADEPLTVDSIETIPVGPPTSAAFPEVPTVIVRPLEVASTPANPAASRPIAPSSPARHRSQDELPRRRRPTPVKRQGISAGLVVALCVGGGIMLMALVVGAVGFVIAKARQPLPPPPPVPVAVDPNQFNQPPRFVHPLDNRATPDVDLFIMDKNGIILDKDDLPDADCHLIWIAPRSTTFQVKLFNCGHPVLGSKSTVTILENGKPWHSYTVRLVPNREETQAFRFQVNASYEFSVETVAEEIPAEVPEGTLPLGGPSQQIKGLMPGQEHVFKIFVPVIKGHGDAAAVVRVLPFGSPAGSDLNLYVIRDRDNAAIGADENPGNAAQVSFKTATTEVFRVRIHNAGKAPANAQVTFVAGS